MQRKLIYIMNHYSHETSQHFYHIINLLNKIADQGIKIALIIEKAYDKPVIDNPNITVYCQRQKNSIKRVIELSKLLVQLNKNGYSKTFIRISINATIVAIIIGKFIKNETYYWQSGTTLEIDKDKEKFAKLKWLLLDYSKLWFVKTYIDYFVTGPETMVDYYINKLKIRKEKMILLYNDIDIKRFKPVPTKTKTKMRLESNIDYNETIILMVHRLSPVRKTAKYLPDILDEEIFKKYNCKLIVIGDGPEALDLKSKIEKRNIEKHVIFLGEKSNSEIDYFYKIADIFVNPSYTEGFPRVIIEAMASGLPIVATNAGGTADIFDEDQKEFIVDRENVDEFRDKLNLMIKNKDIIKSLGKLNMIHVKKFSTEEVSKMYIERIFNSE